jgi:vacuolar protein sorting-associated protein 11
LILRKAESNLAMYGRALLDNLPDETTQLVIDLCTTTGSSTVEEPAPLAQEKQPPPTASYFSFLTFGRLSSTAPGSITDAAVSPSPSVRAARQEASSQRGLVREAAS